MTEPRPHLRPDGFPTRSDMQHWTEGEKAIWNAVQVIEHMGGSPALTDAVNLLQRARSRVADHVEGETGSKIGPPSNRPRRDYEEGMTGRVYDVCGACVKKQNERLAAEYDDYDDADWDDGELDDEMSVRNVGDEFGRILGDALKKR